MKKTLTFFLVLLTTAGFAQKATSPFARFGKITPQGLQTTIYPIDSNANAVILSDIGDIAIEGNNKGWFSQTLTRHAVIHILNKNGYDEANISVPLYVPVGSEETVSAFKAVTYNLENGKIVETKLSKSDLIKEKLDNNRALLKFTMPQVREGSIIEFTYKVTSEYISVPDPWYFQSTSAPTLWSEVNFEVPEFFKYSTLNRGYVPINFQETKNTQRRFTVRDVTSSYSSGSVNFEAAVTRYRFVVNDAPELKVEPYTRSIKNHVARMEFQLMAQTQPLTPRSYRGSWQEITNSMLESEHFGRNLNTNNNWLKDELKPIIQTESDPLARAQKIYAYVRDQFKTTNQYGVFMDNNLKSIFKSKKGSVSELNLLLTAMLRYADLQSDPVMLSTANNGYVFEFIPMIVNMNYVICKLTIGNKDYFLDASRSKLAFNRLPEYCYNGFGCVIDKNATSVNLSPDSVLEQRQVTFFAGNTEQGYQASVNKKEGYYSSLRIRNEIEEKGRDEYFQTLQKNYTSAVLSDFHVEALDKYDEPLNITYNMDLDNHDESIIYLNPLFGENYSKNPFASLDRSYPVEMPYRNMETIIATIEIPKGYIVDEIPKSIQVNLDQTGQTFFKYQITNSNGFLTVQSQLKIGKTFFQPEEYELLREFFNLITKKQGEQIVFKKAA